RAPAAEGPRHRCPRTGGSSQRASPSPPANLAVPGPWGGPGAGQGRATPRPLPAPAQDEQLQTSLVEETMSRKRRDLQDSVELETEFFKAGVPQTILLSTESNVDDFNTVLRLTRSLTTKLDIKLSRDNGWSHRQVPNLLKSCSKRLLRMALLRAMPVPESNAAALGLLYLHLLQGEYQREQSQARSLCLPRQEQAHLSLSSFATKITDHTEHLSIKQANLQNIFIANVPQRAPCTG
ncbi:hypothetical protein DV515_00003766, partial [Chloebia gouldiae]